MHWNWCDTMTQRERLMAVFEKQPKDALPYYLDMGFWAAVAKSENDPGLPKKYANLDWPYLDIYRDIGWGIRQDLISEPYTVSHSHVEVERKHEKNVDGYVVKTETFWHTPAGTLHEVHEYSPDTHTWQIREYAVKNPSDIDILCLIHEDMKVAADCEPQAALIQRVGGQGVVSSRPQRSTPFSRLMTQWLGMERTCYAVYDYPDKLARAIDAMSASDDPIYDIIGEAPAPLVIFDDNITGELVSPAIFERYYVPYYRKRARQLHARGKYIYVHVDGKFRDILPLMAGSEVDCVQAITPAPVCDVPVEELRALAGPDVIIWGGIPAVFLSRIYPEHVFREAARACIELYRDDPRFVLGVEDQVPPDADIARLDFVRELIDG